MDERLLREHRLRDREGYQRCYRQGRKRHGALVSLHYVPNELEHPRIGITASRKVGNSVVRHRLKRRVKEVYRRWKGRERLPEMDFVVHLKPAARHAPFGELHDELLRLLREMRPADRSPERRRRRRKRRSRDSDSVAS